PFLRDNHQELRQATLNALWQIGEEAKDAIPSLEEVIRTASTEEKIAIAGTLAAIDHANSVALDVLISALGEKSDARRKEALFGLATMGRGAKKALPELIKQLDDPSAEVRIAALRVFKQIGPEAEGAIASIQRLWEADEDQSVQRAAGDALLSISKKK